MWSSLADKKYYLALALFGVKKMKAFSLFLLHSVSMISIFDHGMMERNRKSDISNSLVKGRRDTRKAATLPEFQVLRCKESSLESLYIFHLNPGISRFHLTREEKRLREFI